MPFPNSSDRLESCRASLAKRGIPFTEDALIETLKRQDNPWSVFYAVVALRDLGTLRAVEPLKRALKFPKQDVQCASILTIAHLAGPAETPFYISALEDKAYRPKLWALWALEDAGDARGIPAVSAYLARRISQAKTAKPNGSFFPTISYGLAYLGRFVGEHPGLRAEFAPWVQFSDRMVEPTRARFAKLFANVNLQPSPTEACP
jgi:HEAT repeat protein